MPVGSYEACGSGASTPVAVGKGEGAAEALAEGVTGVEIRPDVPFRYPAVALRLFVLEGVDVPRVVNDGSDCSLSWSIFVWMACIFAFDVSSSDSTRRRNASYLMLTQSSLPERSSYLTCLRFVI